MNATQVRRSLLGTVGFLVVAISSGRDVVAADPAEAIRETSKKVNEVGNAFGRACGRALNDNSQENLDRARVLYVDCLFVLRRAMKAAPDLQFTDNEEGRDLRIAHERWLRTQITNMQTLGMEYLEIVEDDSLTSDERRDRLLELVEKQVAVEKPFNDQLNKALDVYENQ